MTATDLDVSLYGYSNEPASAVVRLETFDRAARLRRALVGLAMGWAGAIAAVFIPVAHLILVPGLAVAGMALFTARLRTSTVVRHGRGTCPDCDTEQDLDLYGRWSPPPSVTCSACQRNLNLRERTSARIP